MAKVKIVFISTGYGDVLCVSLPVRSAADATAYVAVDLRVKEASAVTEAYSDRYPLDGAIGYESSFLRYPLPPKSVLRSRNLL